ncbi:MAG: ABC transporter ATP-binding protein [Oscillospiraceae bacterium]
MSIDVSKLSFSYGTNSVLKDVSFTAQEGDLLCVLGPNGVGKSTLFRCMLGLQEQFDGTVTVNGSSVAKMSAARRALEIAYIPQVSTPAFNYTVLNTVLMGTTAQLTTLSSPKKEQEEAAFEALKRFGIAHLSNRGCAQISGGERQLALIARAVVQQAKILIMDEPTANLDFGNQIRVMHEIKSLTKSGYTVILSTHNPDHALMYADKVLALLGGKVLQYGTRDEVLTQELISKLYEVSVRLEQIQVGDKNIRVCVPLSAF